MAKKKVSKSTRKKAVRKKASKKKSVKKSTAKKAARKSPKKSSKKSASKGRSVRVTKATPAKPRKPAGKDMQTRAIIGLAVNLLILPGLGTIIGGSTKSGIWQLVLFIIGLPLSIVLIGIPMVMGAWIWALVSSVKQIQSAS